MDINANELHVPSGFEVGSASLHMPTSAGEMPPHIESRTWKEKLVAFPRERIAKARPKIEHLRSTATVKMNDLSTNLRQQLRSKPAMWAGIAAGAGLALGIAGRIARHRRADKSLPTLVIIEGTC